ncbi:trans-aconitate 2-methyltransferase [Paenisporosarcina sp. OV554]|uniref:class I SAM-dependent methyltransferase n=1 Tax=Paenisporosarcina sp. OV554 TaxID=2135694 RepID=UPI000D39E542|nr:class I SAM-dependent methyltransferase [Paenisporosarcina sp. OV554]PUB15935.1 putative AdoMet-dependent methyltransferase [Paenisporosarcina sp. OV554]
MGREFVEIFDKWVESYDASVSGQDPEYRDVFEKYDEILSAVTNKSLGAVVEFGTGTGNLTAKLLEAGHSVIGIEPNDAMRRVTAKRFPDLVLIDGDLLDFEKPQKVETFVSTYVFHHLKDSEKEKALLTYASILPVGGKIVFADTVFTSEEAKQAQISKERARGFNNVADDLEREYYTTIPVLTHAFEKAGFDVQFEQMNDFVWLMDAIKK